VSEQKATKVLVEGKLLLILTICAISDASL